MSKKYKNLQPHKLREVDKSGFPIDDKGRHVALFDGEGAAVLQLSSNLLIRFPEGAIIKFDPMNKLEVNKALDSLVEILISNSEIYINGSYTLDLTNEAKIKHNIVTNGPITIPHVQIYFSWIDNWLRYLGNTYNIEFKVLFYSKFKERLKPVFISLQTDLNNKNVPKKYLKYVKKWLKETDKNIELEYQAREKKLNHELNSNLPCEKDLKNKDNYDSKEKLSLEITHHKRVEISDAIKAKYVSYKGKDFKILFEALLFMDLFPNKGKRSVFFRCLKNDGFKINSLQMLEDRHFTKGFKNNKGEYIKSKDEIQRDGIIQYLKTIINPQ